MALPKFLMVAYWIALVGLTITGFVLGIIAVIDHQNVTCVSATPAGKTVVGAAEASQIAAASQVQITTAARADNLRYPSIVTSSGIVSKIMSYSPITGEPVAGVRYVPYFSRAPHTTRSSHQTIATFENGDILLISRPDENSGQRFSWYTYQEASEAKYYERQGGKASWDANPFSYPFGISTAARKGGFYAVLPVSSTGVNVGHVTHGGSTYTSNPVTMGAWSGTIGIATSITELVEDNVLYAKFAVAATRGTAAVINVIAMYAVLSVESTALNNPSNVLSLALTVGSAGFNVIQKASAIAHEWYLGAQESVTGLIRRWTLSYPLHSGFVDITTVATMDDIVINAAGYTGTSIVAPGFSPNNQWAIMSDDVVLMVVKVQAGSQTLSVFVGFDFDPATTATYDITAPWYNVNEGNTELRILAHDPTDDTMIISWTENLTKLRIAYVQWDSANKAVILIDRVELPGAGAIMSATVQDKSAGKYVIANHYGQVAPLWISPTQGTISFNPTLGRRPMGYVDAEGSLYALGMVVELDVAVALEFTEGNKVFCKEDGDLTPDSDLGQRVPVGLFLGEDNQMILSTDFTS